MKMKSAGLSIQRVVAQELVVTSSNSCSALGASRLLLAHAPFANDALFNMRRQVLQCLLVNLSRIINVMYFIFVPGPQKRDHFHCLRIADAIEKRMVIA